MRVVVVTGPHPPPPLASSNPPIKPRGAIQRGETGPEETRRLGPGRRKRPNTTAPRRNKKAETPTRAASSGNDDSSSAPQKAPAAPGSPRYSTRRESTLPKRQWASPETRVVATSPACTEADARAGAIPRVRSRDEDVTP